MKVLIIEDEPGVVEMYSEYLKMNGVQVLSAPDGEQGIKIAKEQKPNLIFLDILMPKYNGLDVLKDIKADQEIQNTPVYLLTNLPPENAAEKSKELGAAGYLVKAQYEPKMVLEVVKKFETPQS